MAAKTFLELYTDALQVSDELSGPGSAAAKTIVKAGINESYAEVSGIRDWKTLENTATVTTVSGTEEYTPVTSSASICRIRRIESVKNTTTKRFLDEELREVFEENYPAPNATDDAGEPLLWYLSGYTTGRDMKIKLYKIPNAVFSLSAVFYEEPLELSIATDVPRIPDQFHYGLTYLGLAKYYEFQKDPMASYYRQLHEQYKQKILNIEYNPSDEMPAFRTEQTRQTIVTGKLGRIYNR